MLLVLTSRQKGRIPSQGFTLVELLVVMAITAILASLLLPALSAAKEKSRRAACGQNMRHFVMAAQMYAGDNLEWFPSGTDNGGRSYRPFLVSDTTYSNLVQYASGTTNVLDCPNVVFGDEPRKVDEGRQIGYCYLGDRLDEVSGPKGPDIHATPKRATDPATNALVADANVYTRPGYSISLKIAPHTERGSVLQNNSSFTRGLPGVTSADIGAKGGNVGYVDGSVRWKSIKMMKDNPGSGDGMIRCQL